TAHAAAAHPSFHSIGWCALGRTAGHLVLLHRGRRLTIRSSRDRFAARLKWWGVPLRRAAQRSGLTQALCCKREFRGLPTHHTSRCRKIQVEARELVQGSADRGTPWELVRDAHEAREWERIRLRE